MLKLRAYGSTTYFQNNISARSTPSGLCYYALPSPNSFEHVYGIGTLSVAHRADRSASNVWSASTVLNNQAVTRPKSCQLPSWVGLSASVYSPVPLTFNLRLWRNWEQALGGASLVTDLAIIGEPERTSTVFWMMGNIMRTRPWS